jgi:hypothetical protein
MKGQIRRGFLFLMIFLLFIKCKKEISSPGAHLVENNNAGIAKGDTVYYDWGDQSTDRGIS